MSRMGSYVSPILGWRYRVLAHRAIRVTTFVVSAEVRVYGQIAVRAGFQGTSQCVD
jgi:hypothetical protein